MVKSSRSRDDRVLVRQGRRHHRETYSAREFRIGVVLLVALGTVIAWVVWRGAHPDPALFTTPEALQVEPATTADRGPLPDALAGEAWSEAAISTFGYENLYVKINGREDYYKSFGFEQLWFVSLISKDDPAVVIDVEAYDLAEARNALGAAAGERPPDTNPSVDESGFTLLHRNALYLTRGRYYVRAIGSDESPAVREQLERLRVRLDETLVGEDLPWAWALFVGALGRSPGDVAYTAENAFSFGFANDVYSAMLEDESEWFVISTGGEESSRELAAQFRDGFASYGTAAGSDGGVDWVEDRYIQTVSGAKSVGSWTVGVRGAPNLGRATELMRKLEEAVQGLGESGSDG